MVRLHAQAQHELLMQAVPAYYPSARSYRHPRPYLSGGDSIHCSAEDKQQGTCM
jgi:hypothetical protein